jgi:hypothetical protein
MNDNDELDEKVSLNFAYDQLFLRFKEFVIAFKFALLKDFDDILSVLKKWRDRK